MNFAVFTRVVTHGCGSVYLCAFLRFPLRLVLHTPFLGYVDSPPHKDGDASDDEG